MPKTILLVEDDEDTRAIYADALRSAGYEVLTAQHGAEGVHLARVQRPKLVLLDIRMPLMDGWDAVRYLRAYRETYGIPICLVSAYLSEAEELERVKAMGIDCFINKPADPREVVAAVASRIGAPDEDALLEDASPEETPPREASREGPAASDLPESE